MVKDWAIQKKPEDRDKILKSWLGEVTKSYFDGEIKGILERATWLGNDQSHYLKVFEEYNLSHLKELIDLVLVEMDLEAKKKHYLETLEPKK